MSEFLLESIAILQVARFPPVSTPTSVVMGEGDYPALSAEQITLMKTVSDAAFEVLGIEAPTIRLETALCSRGNPIQWRAGLLFTKHGWLRYRP